MVLHPRLFNLLEEAALLRQYGGAYTAVRQTIIMEKACTLLGLKLGYKKDAPITVVGVSITQVDLIKYFSFGTGNTFWNARSVHALAVRARDFIERLGVWDRQANQTDTLHVIRHLLDADILALPSAPGSASTATSISRRAFETQCAVATGTNARR